MLTDLAPGEVLADRYDPADEVADAPRDTTSPEFQAALAEWEAHPFF